MGPAVKTIGASAFANTKLTYLDLSEATSLVEIGEGAFFALRRQHLAGTLMIPSTVTKIGPNAFYYTKLARLDLSKATSLVEIGDRAFSNTDLAEVAGTLWWALPSPTPSSRPLTSGTAYLSEATSLVDLHDAA